MPPRRASVVATDEESDATDLKAPAYTAWRPSLPKKPGDHQHGQ
jgi:hypothetical protein